MHDSLSIWELAHRIEREFEVDCSPPHLSPKVASAIQLLVNEIHDGRLESDIEHDDGNSLIDREASPFSIERHLVDMWEIREGRNYPKLFLDLVHISKKDFLAWCSTTDRKLELHWDGLNLVDFVNTRFDGIFPIETRQSIETEKITKSLYKGRATRVVQLLAINYWKHDPTINVTHMSQKPDIAEHGKHVTQKTLLKWLRPYAPDSARKPGRPSKKT